MNYWKMQIHPNDKKNFTQADAIKILKYHGIVGMGRQWENDKNQPQIFSERVEIGDIILIHHDGPLALVKVKGPVFNNTNSDIWFDIAREILVISFDGKGAQEEYTAQGFGDWKKGMFMISTFQTANESGFIKYWYKKVREKAMIEEYISLLTTNKNLVLTGAPGTGKTHIAFQIAKAMTGATSDDDKRIGFVQFHPSYDYSDFVEGIKPELVNGSVTLAVHDGIFKQFCKKAVADADGKYVFIIDEINRAELSRVFGELFFGLEESYRGKPIKTQYSYLQQEKAAERGETFVSFTIPKNVYIIGTMNDIDRSVESLDFALRRRFAWKEIAAAESEIIIDASTFDQSIKDQAKKRMDALNLAILDEMGSAAYQIGGAYFKKLELYQDDSDCFGTLWKNHLEVVLFEYVRGMPRAVDMLKRMKDAYNKAQ